MKAALVLFAAAGACTSTFAQVQWSNPAGGAFEVGANWLGCTAPCSADTAEFGAFPGPVDITLGLNSFVAALAITQQLPTFSLGSSTLAVSNNISTQNQGFRLTSGTLSARFLDHQAATGLVEVSGPTAQLVLGQGAFLLSDAPFNILAGGRVLGAGLETRGLTVPHVLRISGAGSAWIDPGSYRADLNIGRNGGTGELIVQAGGEFTVSSINNVFIGRGANTSGYATADGAGSRLNLGSELQIGDEGSLGQLTLTNGGVATCQWFGIGRFPGGGGSVSVNGVGSRLESTITFFTNVIGGNSPARLDISDGGLVIAPLANISPLALVHGNATLQSTLTNRGRIAPGPFAPGGANTLTIQGSLINMPTGAVEIDITRTNLDLTSDRLAVTGPATLRGELRFTQFGPGTPPLNSSAILLTASNVTGQFDTVTGAVIGGVRFLGVEYTPTQIAARVFDATGLQITPQPVQTYAGFTVSAAAFAAVSSGPPQNVTGSAQWSSDASAVAQVNAAGVVTGIAPGSTTLRASFVGFNAQAPLQVLAMPANPSTQAVSTDSAGVLGAQASGTPILTADGRLCAFDSSASNLVTGDTNGTTDCFVKDRLTNQTRRIDVSSTGEQGASGAFGATIAAGGRFTCFTSASSNLVPGDTNNTWDIFVHDLQTGVTERVSLAADGTEGNAASIDTPAISADGRFVAFGSSASNLVPGDTNNVDDVFIKDRQTGAISRVSVGPGGTESNGYSFSPGIVGAGRYIVFTSTATNLAAGDANAAPDIFVHDRQTGITELISCTPQGIPGNGASATTPRRSMSEDGRYVTFSSDSTNLAPDANGVRDIFVRDRWLQTTRMVSLSESGVQTNGGTGSNSISGDGRIIVYRSAGTNLVSGDTNGRSDVFAYDQRTGRVSRESLSFFGVQGDGDSTFCTINYDGSVIAFQSDATNFAPFDQNAATDVFTRAFTPPCYANCDGSTISPVLNVNDFSCFLNKFAAGSSLANCDGSTIAPVLNVNDFSCFLNAFAAGCP